MTTKLFTLPIIDPSTSSPGKGSFVCTSLSPQVYLLTFTSPPDNRLTTSFCQTFLLALDILEFSYPAGVLITTSGISKFYSNGLDLDHWAKTPGYVNDSLYKLWERLLTYHMPSIALLNGHAFAGGLMLAMFHDYRIFNPTRGFLCLNELDFGAALLPPMASIFREKLADPKVYRSMILESKRFTAKEALEGGIVDVLGGIEEVGKLVEERKLIEKTKSGAYKLLKKEMYRETMGYLGEDDKVTQKIFKEKGVGEEQRKKEGKSRVQEWERNDLKAKL
ncbi:hypothetical protein B7494_g6754 [Chlorociboria aeruginascens]|nr:hypothetical protein B7494_g6754 [Chlorociboria aeruginascens]